MSSQSMAPSPRTKYPQSGTREDPILALPMDTPEGITEILIRRSRSSMPDRTTWHIKCNDRIFLAEAEGGNVNNQLTVKELKSPI